MMQRSHIALLSVMLLLLVTTACGDSANNDTDPASVTEQRVPANDPVGVGHEGIGLDMASPDASGKWEAVTVEGVTVEVPRASDWRIDIVVDPCSTTLSKWVLLECKSQGARIKVDLASGAFEAEYGGAESRLDPVLDRIQRSIQGSREIPKEIEGMAPFPTSSACDPKAGVPTLRPLPEETQAPIETVAPAATVTPVTPPAPPASTQ